MTERKRIIGKKICYSKNRVIRIRKKATRAKRVVPRKHDDSENTELLKENDVFAEEGMFGKGLGEGEECQHSGYFLFVSLFCHGGCPVCTVRLASFP